MSRLTGSKMVPAKTRLKRGCCQAWCQSWCQVRDHCRKIGVSEWRLQVQELFGETATVEWQHCQKAEGRLRESTTNDDSPNDDIYQHSTFGQS